MLDDIFWGLMKNQFVHTEQYLRSAEKALVEKDTKLQELVAKHSQLIKDCAQRTKRLEAQISYCEDHIKHLTAELEKSKAECKLQSDSANLFLEKALKLKIELNKLQERL